MSARIKALGVMTLVVLWFACFAVSMFAGPDSVLGWITMGIFLLPVLVAMVICFRWLAASIYHDLVEHFEGKNV